jgi:regulator of protease activity HflC (stomatin/prohibitin superfamily)
MGHGLVIVLLFVATWALKPKLRRVARFGHAIFALTLLLATRLFLYLDAPARIATIEANGLYRFLLGGTGARVLVSIVVALLASLVVLLGPLLVVLYASSEWVLAMPKVSGVTRWQAIRLLLSLVFNTSYPYYLVEDGELTQSKPKGILPALGGPGVAVIKPYNAVVFERAGNITRIEGPGMFLTERFEFIKKIIDLRKQWIEFTAEDVLTRDHVPVSFGCGVGFRIEARKDTAKRVEEQSEAFEGSRFVGIIGGDYPVYKRTIYRAVYGTTAAGWRLLSKGATETQLRAVLRQYRLEDLYRLRDDELTEDESVIDEIAREVQDRVSQISPHWGTTITTLVIKTLEAPADVKDKLLELWAAEYDGRKLQVRTAAEAEALVLKSEAEAAALTQQSQAEARALYRLDQVRRKARQTVIRQLQYGLGQASIVDKEVATRFITAVERISRNLVSDSLTSTRYLEMLEKIAESKGTKTLIIGEDKRLIGPGRGEKPEEE